MPENMLITVIGRGHGGTRAMSHTLSESGVYMGGEVNLSGDLVPAEPLYEACRGMARKVQYLGDLQWDFSRLFSEDIDPEFISLVDTYLQSVLNSDAPRKGWKLPETTLVFPWIARMFPGAWYIHWIRDPRDSILGGHLTDDLSDFGIEYDIPFETSDPCRARRAISWLYQVQIVKATPTPKHWCTVRFEDFVLDQDQTLTQLEDYLGFPLERIEVRPDAVGRYKKDEGEHAYRIFKEELRAHSYPH